MKIRVIIDTNLLISFLIGGEHSKLDPIFDSSEFSVLFSSELLEEFTEVAARPKFASYVEPSDLQNLLRLFDDLGESISVTSSINRCRDPKDDFLLALAVDGQADYLVTGDHDLLEIGSIEKTAIVTFSSFMSKVSD